MSDQNGLGKLGVAFSLPIVLLLAVVFGGLGPGDDPARPSDSASSSAAGASAIPAGPGLYSQDAKLWEDPLKYVRQAEKELGQVTPADNAFRAERFVKILRKIAAAEERQENALQQRRERGGKTDSARNPGGLLLLPVMVSGGGSAEQERNRVQTREAVVQALMSRGYRLQYPNRLSYMRIPFRIGLGSQSSVYEITVPIKLYEYRPAMEDGGVADNGGYQYVLVYWIDQGQLGSQPLASIAQIVLSLFIDVFADSESEAAAEKPRFDLASAGLQRIFFPRPEASASQPEANTTPPDPASSTLAELSESLQQHVDLAIIGPRDSDGLFDMFREDARWEKNYPTDSEQDAAIQITPTPADDEPFRMRNDYFQQVFRSARIYSTRSTVDRYSMVLDTDDNIAEEIRSGGRFMLHDCGIDLIHFIGTDIVLAETIKEELQVRNKWPTPDFGHMILVTERDTLYGTLADRAFLDAGVPPERCHVIRYLKGGRSGDDDNVDPLNQIRGKLNQLQQEQMDTRNVTSVGVLGSNASSKVELLKYVRQRFPSAVIFTTELSAELFGKNTPQEIRNTIVASHFGLSLNPKLNLEAPGFETNYQTATFAAALTLLRSPVMLDALGNIADDPWGRRPETSRKREPLRPVLYELGRNGPFQLSLRDPSTRPAAQIQPEPARRLTSMPATWLFLALLVILLLLSVWLLAQVEKRVEKVVAKAMATAARMWRASRAVATLPTEQALAKEEKIFRVSETFVVISVFALLALFAAGVVSDQRRGGEPIDFLDGISVWPSVWLLALIGAVAFSMLPKTRQRLGREAGYVGRHKIPKSALVDQDGKPTKLAAVSLKIGKLLDDYESHLRRGDTPKIVAISIGLAIVGYLLIYMFGVDPSAPARGLLAINTAFWVQIFVALILVAYVCQATYNVFAAREACTEIIKKNTLYVESIADQQIRGQVGSSDNTELAWNAEMQEAVVRQANVALHLVEMIANHTRIVSRPVEYAALFVLLFGLARTRVFDAWENSAPALSLLLTILLVCIGSLWLVRSNCARRRTELVTSIRRLAISVEIDDSDPNNPPTSTKLRKLADSIDSVSKGVFRPFGADPIFRAFIYAFGAFVTAANQWITSLVR